MTQSFLNKASNAGLYYLPASRQHLLSGLVSHAHLSLLVVDIAPLRALGEILAELGRALQFPTWFGANFDALHDCLTDPDWQKGKPIAISINGLGELQQHDPEAFSTLIEVLASAAGERTAEKHPLWILLDAPAQGIPALPEA